MPVCERSGAVVRNWCADAYGVTGLDSGKTMIVPPLQ